MRILELNDDGVSLQRDRSVLYRHFKTPSDVPSRKSMNLSFFIETNNIQLDSTSAAEKFGMLTGMLVSISLSGRRRASLV
jgi:hypothetical protein